MIAILRLLMILGGIAGGAMYVVKKLSGAENVVKGVNQKHLEWLKGILHSSENELVALNSEEIGLLSLNIQRRIVNQNGAKILFGVFKSVYNEALVEFTQLLYETNQSLIVVQTKQLELVYRVFLDFTDIYVNGNFLGKLNNDGRLFDPLNAMILARIDPSREARLQEIRKSDKSLGSVLNPLMDHSQTDRVLPLYEYTNHEEKVLLLSLTILNSIQRT